MKTFAQSFFYDPFTVKSTEENFIRFSSNSEAYASKLLENLEEMITHY